MKNHKTTNGTILASQLMKLFENEMKDIYWAEKAVNKVLPKMIKHSSSRELIDILTNHLTKTEKQITRMERVFKSIDRQATTKKCEALDSLIKEAEENMESCDSGPMCDAGIILVSQKIEQYKIASYGTLRQFAETLGLKEAVLLLDETLNEEKEADDNLTRVATNALNVDAAYQEV